MKRLLRPLLLALTLPLIVVTAGSSVSVSSENVFARVSFEATHSAKCTGAKDCRACKNCRYCKHCNAGGGTCGVCR